MTTLPDRLEEADAGRVLSPGKLAATLQSVALAIRIVGLDNLDKVKIGGPAAPAMKGEG